VLSDRGDWVHRDYEKVMTDLVAASARKDELERQVIDGSRSIANLQEEARSLQHAREELREALAEREGRLTQSETALAARDASLVARDREILRRRGWRWWLRLPFVRMGILDE
jgi:septal ring factor EnvC (AmiA/AmiB activator)